MYDLSTPTKRCVGRTLHLLGTTIMLKIIIILFLWCSVSEASEYSIVTYNVWFDYSTSEERVPKLLDAIEKPDVIAFQEVKRWFVNYLERDGRFSKRRVRPTHIMSTLAWFLGLFKPLAFLL